MRQYRNLIIKLTAVVGVGQSANYTMTIGGVNFFSRASELGGSDHPKPPRNLHPCVGTMFNLLSCVSGGGWMCVVCVCACVCVHVSGRGVGVRLGASVHSANHASNNPHFSPLVFFSLLHSGIEGLNNWYSKAA